MEVSEAMQRSYGSVVGRAQVLGLKKDPAYIRRDNVKALAMLGIRKYKCLNYYK